MKTSNRTAAALFGVTLAVVSVPTNAQLSQCATQPNAVMIWACFADESTTAGRPPVDSEYLLALASLAVWDAILAIEEPAKYEPYASSPVVVQPASPDAAVATAAFEVLRTRVPAQASILQDKYDTFMAAIAAGPAKTNGIAVGQSAAQAVLAARAADNFNNVVSFVQPPPGPGVFEPTTLLTPVVSLVLATVQPLGNRNIGDFRAPPPPSLTSKQYGDDFNEVAALGRASGSTRTPLQTETARFWNEKADIQYERALRTLAQAKSLDSFETARLNGMVHGCVADASLEGFHTKYFYMFWRPFHSIPRADTDGNPDTASDPLWTPFLNVNHPEYPSAHSFFTAALATALKRFFRTDRLNWEISSTVTGTTRVYADLDDLVSELQNARIYAGLHYRFSVEAGAKLGRELCRNFLADHLRRLDDDDDVDQSDDN